MDVIHIGYHKTGSTWLQHQVFPTATGLYYTKACDLTSAAISHLITSSDADLMHTAIRQVFDECRQRNGRLLISNEGLSGSLWQGGSDGTRTAQRLARFLPDAKILMLVREQGSMLWSLHAQYIHEGGTLRFTDFLNGHAGFDPHHLQYDKLAATYRHHFGHENVLVLPHEVLRSSRTDALAHIAGFIQADLPVATLTTENRSLSRPSLAFLRWWNTRFRESKFNQNPPLPIPFAGHMRRLLQLRIDPHISEALRGIPKSNEQVLDVTTERYAPSNQRLQRFVTYDLARLGYRIT